MNASTDTHRAARFVKAGQYVEVFADPTDFPNPLSHTVHVESVEGDKARVFYLDFGGVETVSLSEVFVPEVGAEIFVKSEDETGEEDREAATVLSVDESAGTFRVFFQRDGHEGSVGIGDVAPYRGLTF